MLHVGEAVASLHDEGIIHRDLKPGNIMIDAVGRVFVTDFGITCDRVPAFESLVGQRVMGTPPYMAPEMFEGILSMKTDVYALAVTLYEMVTGSLPISLGKWNPEDAFNPLSAKSLEAFDVPQAIIELLERALNVNARFRTKSARQFAESLRRASALAGVPLADDRELANLAGGTAVDRSDPDSTSGGTSRVEKSSGWTTRLAELAAKHRQQSIRPSAERDDGPSRTARWRVRMPLRKLYRAFPEFDHLSNEQCEALMRRIWVYARFRRPVVVWTMVAAVTTLMAGGFLLAVLDDSLVRLAYHGGRTTVQYADLETTSIWVVFVVGVVPVVTLLVRDIVLRRYLFKAIRLRKEFLRCQECDHSLIGQADDGGGVVCPECGYKTSMSATFGYSPQALVPDGLDEVELCGECGADLGFRKYCVKCGWRVPSAMGRIPEIDGGPE